MTAEGDNSVEMRGISWGFYRVCEWIVKLSFVNILWLSIFHQFWSIYKRELVQANLMGYCLVLLGALLLVDLYFFYRLEGVFGQIVFYLMVAVFINYLVMLLYIIPVYVHYHLRFFQYIKYAIVLGMSNPLHTLGMILSIVFVYFILELVPASILFLSVAPLSWIMMLTTYRIFTRIEEKNRVAEEHR